MAIKWDRIRETLPETAEALLRDIQQAFESSDNDPARAVDETLAEKISGLKARFEAVKKEAAK